MPPRIPYDKFMQLKWVKIHSKATASSMCYFSIIYMLNMAKYQTTERLWMPIPYSKGEV